METPPSVGPILVHYKKAFPTYLFYALSLVVLRKDLAGLLAFGTDGEEALAQAFKHEFHFAVHLACFIHKCRNIEIKLKEMGFSTEAQRAIADDVLESAEETLCMKV